MVDPSNNHKLWSSANNMPNRDMMGMDSFGKNMGNAANNLQGVEDDILTDMISPTISSMNAPKPMYNNQQNAEKIAPNVSDLGDNDNNYIIIPPADINSAFNNNNLFYQKSATKESVDEHQDEDDEKDVLLDITPGGPDDDNVTPGGPIIDPWI